MPNTSHNERTTTEPPPTWALANQPSLELSQETFAARTDSANDKCHEDSLDEAELLGVMSRQQVNPEAARNAWGELYRRHARYVSVSVARGYSDSIGGASAVSDVVVDAFQAAFKWAAEQPRREDVLAKFHAPDPDITRRRVLGWLTVIARRLALHRIVQSSSHPAEHFGCDYDSCPDASEESEPPPSGYRAQLQDALVHLQQGERDVLQLSLQWYDPELRQFNLPRGEAARVAASLGISAGTFRQRRCRALKRLQSLLATRAPV